MKLIINNLNISSFHKTLENIVQKINEVADSASSVQTKNLLAAAPQRVSLISALSKNSEEVKRKLVVDVTLLKINVNKISFNQ